MEFDSLQSACLARWQHLHLQDQTGPSDPSTKAGLIRNLLAQVQYSNDVQIISAESARMLTRENLVRYSSIVDEGLNCYTEDVLALTQDHQNESRQWGSSLSLESAMTMHSVQAFLKDTQTANNELFPAGNRDDILSLGPHTTTDVGRIQASDISGRQPLFQSSNRLPPSDGSNKPSSVVGRGSGGVARENWEARREGEGRRMEGEGRGYRRNPLASRGNTDTMATSDLGSLWSEQTTHGRQSLKRPHEDATAQCEEDVSSLSAHGRFRTARDQLAIDDEKKLGNVSGGSYGASKRCLGTRRGPGSRFVPPVMNKDDSDNGSGYLLQKANKGCQQIEGDADERLKNIDVKMVELITNEIIDHGPPVTWDQIAGLQFAKKTITEIVIWPMLRPDIFTGLRGPPKGLLLFGPPGTGKTLIGKCMASQSKSTFFNISASSLTSKWVGEGEKMVRALFAVARIHQPAVIFIDEIDSLLSQRSDGEHESSRRIKTEFLVQLDGATTSEADRILVVGATNRPQEIDEAARRRFVKRLYIPLPEADARRQIVTILMTEQTHCLTDQQLTSISDQSHGFSGADVTSLCREAALGPIRSIQFTDIEDVSTEQVRPISYEDFEAAFCQVKPSVSEKDLHLYVEWNNLFGSWTI